MKKREDQRASDLAKKRHDYGGGKKQRANLLGLPPKKPKRRRTLYINIYTHLSNIQYTIIQYYIIQYYIIQYNIIQYITLIKNRCMKGRCSDKKPLLKVT